MTQAANSTAANTAARGTAAAAPAPRRRLGTRARRGVLVVHIASAGAWLGIDVAMAVVIFTALLTDSPSLKALSFQALELFAVWPLLVTGLVCLASGIVLGLGSKWGVVRYWWVAVKLVLNVVLTTLVLIGLAPQVFYAAEQARRWLAGLPAELSVGDLIFPPLVSPAALMIAMILSVVKPWGPVRRRRTGAPALSPRPGARRGG